MTGLYARPLTLLAANIYVDNMHRHHEPATGHRFSIGGYLPGDRLVGVCIVGRPVGRNVNQWHVAEVSRLATDGTDNTCSFLYARAARAAKAMGFIYIQTYTLLEEPGTSLKAAGWKLDGITEGGSWRGTQRPDRKTSQPEGPKRRWRLDLNPE